MAADDPILGGETPFVSFSDGARFFGPGHKPMRVEVKGVEATRDVFLMMCAMMRRLLLNGQLAQRPGDPPLDEFMREYIAGANHDLRAAGLHPLISIAEVVALSEHPKIVAACAAKGATGG